MAKEMNPVVCGITGETLTEWNQRTFVQRYIGGKLQTLPLYLDINAVLDLHRQSDTYIDKKAKEKAFEQTESYEYDEADGDSMNAEYDNENVIA
jgi:hypothetical protein|tara:strand:- start:325 stop:606 length:282 start_codon:yes stop_codon:yes gene_type:complete